MQKSKDSLKACYEKDILVMFNSLPASADVCFMMITFGKFGPRSGVEVIKLFSMLNSTEYEISSAHKNKMLKNKDSFLLSNSQLLHLSC